MSKKETLDELDVIDLIDDLESEYDSSEAALDSISDLNQAIKDEVTNAIVAQKLLAQLEEVSPPHDLPMKTARRARRRRREQLKKTDKSWLDLLLSVAIIIFVIALISIVFHQLQDQWSRQVIEQINPLH